MKKYVFSISIGITALMMAAISAFFSITGMGKIFEGTSIIVMTTAIETGKLVTVSVLYRLWKELKWWKAFLVPMVIVLMLITNMGVYGHLSSSYEGTAAGLGTQNAKVELETKRKEALGERIAFYEQSITRKQDRANSLSGLRAQQENRMDSLYAKNQLRMAKNVQNSIVQTDAEISKLNDESDSLNSVVEDVRMEMSSIDSTIVHMEAENSKGDTGALKYISRVSGWSMDSVVNVIMLLIIFVLDPLAIILVVAFNIAYDKAKKGMETTVWSEPHTEESHDEQGSYDENNEGLPWKPAEEEVVIPPVVYETNENGEFVKADPVAKAEPVGSDGMEQQVQSDSPTEASEPVSDIAQTTQEVEPIISSEPPELHPDAVKKKSIIKKAPMNKTQLYSALLYLMYQDGKLNEHDNLDNYEKFIERIAESNIECTEEEVDEFLKKCILLRIIRIGKNERHALKNYKDAVAALSADIG